MDKYQAAIAEYERCRKLINNLSAKICDASVSFDDEGIVHLCENQCDDKNGHLSDCVKRYWDANREAHYAREATGETVEAEHVSLCPSCKEVDRLVQERKAVKRHFGIAKRRLSQLGKSLISESDNANNHN